MAKERWTYWGGFIALTVGSLGMLFVFVFGFLPQRFLLELDFTEGDYSYPVVWPEPPQPPPPAGEAQRPIPRTPAERLWAEYLPLAEAGELEEAAQLLARYLERFPDDVGVRLEYGRVLWKLGRLGPAIEAYRTALARLDDRAAERELAQLYTDARLFEQALSIYRRLTARRPPEVELWLEYGRAAAAAQRFDEALTAYAAALERRRGDLELLRAYAQAAMWAGEYRLSMEAYAELLEARPNDLDLLERYAELALWAQAYDAAAGAYARLVEERPTDPELRVRWARALYLSGRLAEADRVLRDLPSNYMSASADSLKAAIALSLPPADTLVPGQLDRARGLMLAGAVDSALVLYRTVLAERPAPDSLLLELADVFQFRAGAPDSAMAYLRLYLDRRPDDVEARLRMARLLAWSGRLDEAEAELLTLLKADPDRAEAWALLGDIHRWSGERVAAARAYDRALAIDLVEPTAIQGREQLDTRVEAILGGRGRVGPMGAFEYLADSDEFRRARWTGGWTLGNPATRAGLQASVERLDGFEPAGGEGGLTAFELGVSGERWWRLGTIRTSGYLGAWMPNGADASAEPVVSVMAEVPELGGASYRLEYRHEPAHAELATLESALAELGIDRFGLSTYRSIADRWELSVRGGAAWISGGGNENLRADAGLGVLFRADERWLLGVETRGLAFRDAAPRPGRRLYWDPEWSWENVVLVGWSGEPAEDWMLTARVTPGVAWLRERDLDPEAVVVAGASLETRYRFGLWSLVGRAGYSQSRAGDYRAFRLRVELERGFAR